ncbi:MAG: hypothetical protein AAB602_03145 [Patescibacteria group bacterium]
MTATYPHRTCAGAGVGRNFPVLARDSDHGLGVCNLGDHTRFEKLPLVVLPMARRHSQILLPPEQTEKPLARSIRLAGVKTLDRVWVEKFQEEYRERYCVERAECEIDEGGWGWRNFQEAVASYNEMTAWMSIQLADWQAFGRLPEVPTKGVASAQMILDQLPEAKIDVVYFYEDPFLLARLGDEQCYFHHFGE